VASVLWHRWALYQISKVVKADFSFLIEYLTDLSNPWSINVGHLIPRDPCGESFGDASTEAGMGFVSHTHKFWCAMAWSPAIIQRVARINHTHQIHINQLEMVAYLLQLVAVCVATTDHTQFDQATAARWASTPTAPQWLVNIDNTTAKSWGERSMARSFRGQLLLRFQAALYHTHEVNGRTKWISTHDNVLADLLSRGLQSPLSLSAYRTFVTQVYQADERLKTYYIFRPSRELTSLLLSILCSSERVALGSLPRNLGRFERAEFTTLDGVIL
jgi:hypothetical protein